MYSKLFWKDALERAIKTAAQAAVTLLTVDGLDLLAFNWAGFTTGVVLASALSVLTSVASGGTGNSASLVVNNVKEKI